MRKLTQVERRVHRVDTVINETDADRVENGAADSMEDHTQHQHAEVML